MSKPFHKMISGWLRDAKVKTVRRDARFFFVGAIDTAALHQTDGFLDRIAIMETALYTEPDDLDGILAELVSVGLFDEVDGGYRIHSYLAHQSSREEIERKQARDRDRKRSASADGFPTDSERNPNGIRMESRRNPRGIRALRNKKEEIELDPHGRAELAHEGADDGFARWWDAYPKKRAKGDALKVWKALKPDAALVDRMVAAVDVAKATRDWQKDGGQFIPYPATWLRRQGWEDELAPEPTAPPPGTMTPIGPYGRRVEARDDELWPDINLAMRDARLPAVTEEQAERYRRQEPIEEYLTPEQIAVIQFERQNMRYLAALGPVF